MEINKIHIIDILEKLPFLETVKDCGEEKGLWTLMLKFATEDKQTLINEFKKIVEYCEKNKSWLYNYALYMAIKDFFGGKSWIEWDEDIRLRKQEEIDNLKIQGYKILETEEVFKDSLWTGSGIKIVSPISLVEDVKNCALDIIKNYN